MEVKQCDRQATGKRRGVARRGEGRMLGSLVRRDVAATLRQATHPRYSHHVAIDDLFHFFNFISDYSTPLFRQVKTVIFEFI